ncbi:UNVERIFIED_CONTAM: hypothetical protein Slati_3675100 [Sesamum latifolium]|uniref:Uncharacterized protein n=1 Tax=Sesamum latifolium TaxID=2727402 RepID=A0AAW2U218_9LAMI
MTPSMKGSPCCLFPLLGMDILEALLMKLQMGEPHWGTPSRSCGGALALPKAIGLWAGALP